MENKILQGSEAWKLAKQKTIGASEIYSLVHHYCWQELKDMGFDLTKERPFRTIQELFLKVKFDAKLSEIDPVHSQFGNGMEPYIAYRLGQEVPEITFERSKEFIVNKKLHPLAACSPDGYVELDPIKYDICPSERTYLDDFDKTCVIDYSWGKGALELKTTNFFANFDQGGSRLQYILQLQYQMAVMDLKWGILAVLLPKEKEFDEPFFKGGILEKVLSGEELDNFNKEKGFCSSAPYLYELRVNRFYDLKYYIYPQLPVFQNLILKALKAFQADLEAYDTDQSRFPRNSEDLAGLQREKQLWAQLWPEHYGTKELAADDELNSLFNERYKAQEALMFAEQDKLKTENEINQLIKHQGLGKYCEIRGTENRMNWIKNGQVRFYKLKEAKE